jgi:ribosomal protein L11 methyltransferase
VFGTGLHPTTALCLELLEELVPQDSPSGVLDVGTGSGVLAIAALVLGVPRAMAIDIDPEAVRVAADNARRNGVGDRLEVSHGGPDELTDAWPLVLANVLAAPLIEMAPVLVRRVAHRGQLVLSGIPQSVDEEVVRAFRRLGMWHARTSARGGWAAVLLRASW